MINNRDPRHAILEHLPALRAFAISLSRDHAIADDVLQDAIIKAWTKFDKFTQGTNLRAWLFTIVRNEYYSMRRKNRNEVADVDGAMAARLSVKPDHDGRLQFNDFEKAFATLPAEQREVLILVGAEGFSYDEAAEMCGVAIGTVKSRINRGRARLTDLLDLDDGAPELTDKATQAIISAGS